MKRPRADSATREAFPYVDLVPELQVLVRDACAPSARLLLGLTCRTERDVHPKTVCYNGKRVREHDAFVHLAECEPVTLWSNTWGAKTLTSKRLESSSGPCAPLVSALAYDGEEVLLRRAIKHLVRKHGLCYAANKYHRLKHLAILGGHADMALRLLDDCVGEGRGACPACLFYVCMMPTATTVEHCQQFMARLGECDYNEHVYDQWMWRRVTDIHFHEYNLPLQVRINRLASASAFFAGNRVLVEALARTGRFDGTSIGDAALQYLGKCASDAFTYCPLRWPVDAVDAMVQWTDTEWLSDYPMPHLWCHWTHDVNALARIVQGRDLLDARTWQTSTHRLQINIYRGLRVLIGRTLVEQHDDMSAMRRFCWETLPRLLANREINTTPVLVSECRAGFHVALKHVGSYVDEVADAWRDAILSPTVCELMED